MIDKFPLDQTHPVTAPGDASGQETRALRFPSFELPPKMEGQTHWEIWGSFPGAYVIHGETWMASWGYVKLGITDDDVFYS